MGVLEDRVDHGDGPVAGLAGVVRAFPEAPPEVGAPPGALRCREDVDLLPVGGADICDPEVARCPIEAEPPRVAKAEGPDLVAGTGPTDERIVVGNGVPTVGDRRAHVDAEQLRQQRPEVLPVVVGVALRTTVAEPDVEVPVGPEGDVAAVVVGEGLRQPQHFATRPDVGDVARHGVGSDHAGPVVGAVGVADEQDGAVGRERQSEQSALAPQVGHVRDEIEDGALGRREHLTVAYEAPHGAGTLPDEQVVGPRTGNHRRRRLDGGDLGQADGEPAQVGRRRRRRCSRRGRRAGGRRSGRGHGGGRHGRVVAALVVGAPREHEDRHGEGCEGAAKWHERHSRRRGGCPVVSAPSGRDGSRPPAPPTRRAHPRGCR